MKWIPVRKLPFSTGKLALIAFAEDDVQSCVILGKRPGAFIQEKWDQWRDRYIWSDAFNRGFATWRKAFNQKWRELERRRRRLV